MQWVIVFRKYGIRKRICFLRCSWICKVFKLLLIASHLILEASNLMYAVIILLWFYKAGYLNPKWWPSSLIFYCSCIHSIRMIAVLMHLRICLKRKYTLRAFHILCSKWSLIVRSLSANLNTRMQCSESLFLFRNLVRNMDHVYFIASWAITFTS